jgi:hypothetical protein
MNRYIIKIIYFINQFQCPCLIDSTFSDKILSTTFRIIFYIFLIFKIRIYRKFQITIVNLFNDLFIAFLTNFHSRLIVTEILHL